MHTTFTTLVKFRDRYTLVKQFPALNSIVISLLVISLPSSLVMLMVPGIVKGGEFVREHMLRN